MRSSWFPVALALMALNDRILADDAKGLEFFEAKIRPVLVKHCYECHSSGAARIRGDLLLDTRTAMRNGGESGPGIIPGDPAKSLIIQAIRHEDRQMPEQKLPQAVIDDFVAWVNMGAPDPRIEQAGYKRLTLEGAQTFWSFMPVRDPPPPAVKQADWPLDPLDRFILAKQEAQGLHPAADAPRVAWLRRVTFDLIGLPPAPEELDVFLTDRSENPHAAVVDRLLRSPHFGERWGRHWLDHVRYAESNGQVSNSAFPFAWRYRDYVLDAFNADMPYDRFIREQIAGDLLPAETPAERDALVIATGFLALTPQPEASANPNFKMDLVADQIDVTGRAVMALSVMCARCHDHKFDPISTKEYYALAGIFESTDQMRTEKEAVKLSQGKAMAVKDSKVHDAYVCVRGESKVRGDLVPRGFLTVASNGSAAQIPAGQSGRVQFAEWLTRTDHPLTARVAVNRIWMHLFGHGLVRSPDNFGFTGEQPSHPELLDHLATRFMQEGWSHKQLIRAIVLSRTYRQASQHHPGNYEIDPDNVHLWRVPVRRLEAEPIRDAILVAAGKLDPTPPRSSTMKVVVKAQGKKRQQYPEIEPNVRSVYLGAPRTQGLPELLAVFDGANPSVIVAQRDVTTVPSQALYLMNEPWVVEQAKHFAHRLLAHKDLNAAERVELGYRLAFSRQTHGDEKTSALSYLQQLGNDESAWTSFCHSLFIAAEFRTIE